MFEIRIIRDKITLAELAEMAQSGFLDFVKGVVDLERGVIAFGGQMHADEERVLLEDGSKQENLWGFNIYPDKPMEEMIEYTSLINIRPRQGNRSMEIENEEIRNKAAEVINKLVV